MGFSLKDIFGGGKQTTTSTSAPWSAAQPTLKYSIEQARDLYDKGIGSQVYTGSTVVPYDQLTKQGMNSLTSLANANMGGNGLSQQYQSIINNGGYTGDQRQAANALSGMVSGNGYNAGMTAANNAFGNIMSRGGMNATMADSLARYRTAADNPFNSQQQAAMSSLGKSMAAGGYNGDMRSAAGQYNDVLKNGGMNSAMNQAMSGYQNLASNPFDKYQQNALNNTTAIANSKFSIQHPAFQQVLKQTTDSARDAVGASASGAGRYGSGIHQQTLANTVGDLTNRAVSNEYNNWQNRRDTANQNLFSMGQTGQGTRMSANSAIGGLGQTAMGNMSNATAGLGALGQNAMGNLANSQNSMFQMGQTGFGNQQNANNAIGSMGQNALSNYLSAAGSQGNLGQTALSNRMSGANSLYQMGQGAFGNLGASYTGMQSPATTLMGVGNMNEDYQTRLMNDQLRIFDANNTAKWDNLGRLNAIASGAGQMGGTTTQAQPGQSPFLQALGIGATGLSLLGGGF